MANHFSALKRVRQTAKRTAINRRNTTQLRRQVRTFRRALKANDVTAAASAFSQTISVIDRGVRKRVINKNTAARYKSRLSLRLNALKAAPAA